MSAHWDALALRESGLWTVFGDLAKALGDTTLVPLVDRLAKVVAWGHDFSVFLLDSEGDPTVPKLGRLSVKPEPGGKMRVFAISDYWTQSLCGGLHSYLMRQLSLIPMDGTWSQGRAADRVRRATSTNSKVYCYDLSAATDRFPARFTELVLRPLIGSEGARAWLSLLVDRDYWYKGCQYRYAAGQPMGTLSSWAAFALSHHVTVQIAAQRVGCDRLFTEYSLLGDDIAIWDSAVAEEYCDLLSWLGVEINPSKSVQGVGFAEFAKRHFWRGQEVTGVPGKLLLLAGCYPSGLRALVETLTQRGWELTLGSVVSAYAVFTTLGSRTRLWRLLVLSLVGPEAPLSQPVLWAGVLKSFPGDLLRGLLVGTSFSRTTTLKLTGNLPIPWSGRLVQEVLRYAELRRVLRARDSLAAWANVLSTTMDSLIRGQIQSYWSEHGVDDSPFGDSGNMVARALIEAGHPATSVSSGLFDLKTDHTETELADLRTVLTPGDRPSSSAIGLAPLADLQALTRCAEATAWAGSVCRSAEATLSLQAEVVVAQGMIPVDQEELDLLTAVYPLDEPFDSQGIAGTPREDNTPNPTWITMEMLSDGVMLAWNPEIVRDPNWVPTPAPESRPGWGRWTKEAGESPLEGP